MPEHAQKTLPVSRVVIQRQYAGLGPVSLDLEVARTGYQQMIGEMFRTKIPRGKGMIFPQKSAGYVHVTLHNCPVGEDVVFVGRDGRILSVSSNVPPEYKDLVSPAPVYAFFELASGEAERLSLYPGDLVQGAF